MIKVLIFLSLCTFAFSLECFDCDNEEECYDPLNKNVKTTSCEAVADAKLFIRAKAIPVNVEIVKECITLYVEANATSNVKTGLYRGCAVYEKKDQNTCDFLKSNSNSTDITKFVFCESCADDKCNKKLYKNGAAGSTFSVIIALLGAGFFFLYY